GPASPSALARSLIGDSGAGVQSRSPKQESKAGVQNRSRADNSLARRDAQGAPLLQALLGRQRHSARPDRLVPLSAAAWVPLDSRPRGRGGNPATLPNVTGCASFS